MFIDSNALHLDAGKLWKNLTMVPCRICLNEYDIIFIHTGVNDIDTTMGEEVAKDLTGIVHRLRHNHPSLKIIVSEVTPRQIFRDDEVKKCNIALNASLRDEDNVTLASHSNLRNEKWTFHKKDDDKHFSRISISLFASNIKNAFRKSLGITLNKYGNKRSNGDGVSNRYRKRVSGLSNDGRSSSHGDIDSFKRDLIKFLSSYKA